MSFRKPPEKTEEADHDLEIWQTARQYAALLGEIPGSFTSITRSLVADGSKGEGILSSGTQFLLQRLLKGKSILAPFYYMTEAIFPEEFQDRVYMSTNEMVGLYRPFDMAAFITMVFLFKKMATACPANEWEFISPTIQRPLAVGAELGKRIPAIGVGAGMLTACMCQLSYGVFLLHDARGFVEYRRKLKSKTHHPDFKWELSRWGCTSAHVAAVFLQIFGLGVDVAEAFIRGTLESSENFSTETDNEVYRYKIARLWLISLLDEGKIPNIAHRGRFYPEGGDVDHLLTNAGSARTAEPDPESAWLNKGRDNISPELTPFLFKAAPRGGVTLSSDDDDEFGGPDEPS